MIEADRSGGRDGLIGDKEGSFEGCGHGHGHGHDVVLERDVDVEAVCLSSSSVAEASGALARDIHRRERSKALPNAPNDPTGPSAPAAVQPLNDDDDDNHGFVVDDIALNPDTHIDPLDIPIPDLLTSRRPDDPTTTTTTTTNSIDRYIGLIVWIAFPA